MKLCIENWFQILLSKFRKKKQETKIGLSNTPYMRKTSARELEIHA